MQALSPQSYWLETSQPPARFPALTGDVRVEVAIIGAGITGLTAALHFKEAGKRVVVLEAGRIGSGTSGGTSAHLDAHPDHSFTSLVSDFGEKSARAMTAARQASIDEIGNWCRRFSIDCDFVRIPAYLYTESSDGLPDLQKQSDAAHRCGLDAAMVSHVPLPFACAGGLRLERQARFHAMRYLYELAQAVQGGSVTLYEETRVMEPPEDGEPCMIRTQSGRILADTVIAATHSSFYGVSSPDMRVAPYQSYVLAATVGDRIEDALYWDDASPYHYTRTAASSDAGRLIIGGEDHKTGQGDDERACYQRLEAYARKKFAVTRIEQRWSAELFEPDDGVPFIGKLPSAKHLYCSTGYSGTGLTWGTVAARVLADAVLGRENPLAEIVSPSRVKPMAAASDFIKENANVVRRFVGDRWSIDNVDSLDVISHGEGRLVSYQGKKLAAYRDDAGTLHVRSPLCTHAGCVVQWNEAERTWDCPCHGGRYSATGERLYGPPPKDLDAESVDV